MSDRPNLVELVESEELIPGRCYVKYYGSNMPNPIPETDDNGEIITLIFNGRNEQGMVDMFTKIRKDGAVDDDDKVNYPYISKMDTTINSVRFRYQEVSCPQVNNIRPVNLLEDFNTGGRKRTRKTNKTNKTKSRKNRKTNKTNKTKSRKYRKTSCSKKQVVQRNT
jgi:hypothetical protein